MVRFALGVLLVTAMVTGVRAEAATVPGASVPGVSWHSVDPASTGWSMERFAAAKAFADKLNATAHMIVWKGEVVASWGDVRRKVDVASVRKSLLSALYGIAVADGKIHLDSTLAQLGIDDKPPSLTSAEKKATVRDLLMARSGVYHQAAHETAAIKRNRPERGSHAPGSFWFYNNWDFNVLGAIYKQATGEDIFWSFAKHIASPIGMEDFNAGDGRYAFDPASSYPAYPFRLSARDAARFGLLYLNGGRWGDRQIVPQAWVRESTTAYSRSNRGQQGYGYMWWVLPADVWGEGAAYAAGHGGEIIAFIPAKQLVVVQIVDRDEDDARVRTSVFLKLLRMIVDAAPN
jgi:CubicO group peptidase (beta-lactamase class C family)